MTLSHTRAPARNPDLHLPEHEAALRQALAWLMARHDSGAISAATYAVVKMLETELAWRQHRGRR
jgi:hypothetical protein